MPNYSLNHARSGSDSLSASISPMWFRPRRSGPLRSYLLPLGDFHELSRAARPNGQSTRVEGAGIVMKSCGISSFR